MKEIKKELLNKYIDLIDRFEERIKIDMKYVADAIQELSQHKEEIAQKVNDSSFNTLTKEAQQTYLKLFNSIDVILKTIEAFSKDEQMQEGFSSNLALECCDLLEKLVKDKSESLYVGREDDKKYREIEKKLEGFLANRKFYVKEGFIAYGEYRLAKTEAKQNSNDTKIKELARQSEEINQKRQRVLNYARKEQTDGLTIEEERELLHLRREIDRYDRRCKRLEESDKNMDDWIDNTEKMVQDYLDELDEIDDFLEYSESSI